MSEQKQPGIVLMVKFKSALSIEEAKERYRERMPEFRELPGLLQKYYVHEPATGEVGGIYIWDSEESLQGYLRSDLRESIPEAYRVVGPPRIEKFQVMDRLFEDDA